MSDELASVIPRLLSAVLTQARFKPEELALALDKDVYSRFLIAPSPRIASGSLGGFGGFLSRRFREHDFMLGRRNCQKFLKTQLVLRANNPLFDDWGDLKRDGTYQADTSEYLPVIPCVRSAKDEVPKPAWPSYGQDDLEQLRPLLEARYDLVGGRLLEKLVSGWATRNLLRGLARLERSKVVGKALKRVEADLTACGLM
jgi:hypothetical protein